MNYEDAISFVLTEMFNRVGAEYTPEKVKAERWFFEHSWTTEEEQLFTTWLENALYEDRKLQRALFTLPVRSKSLIKKQALWFVFTYGWKTI